MRAQDRSPKRSRRPAVITLAIGNTNATAVAWSAEGALLRSVKNELAFRLPWPDGDVVLAGVVPLALRELEKRLRRARPGRVSRFRKDLPCRLRIRPRPAAMVGDDRLAAALGALALDPGRPWVVLDAGTALTVNSVRLGAPMGAGVFEGGLIVPGEKLSLCALGCATAQLPHVPPWPAGRPAPVLGRSTGEALRVGARRAQIAAAVALARAQAEALGPRTRVALTGGGAKILWPEVRKILRVYRPVLVPELVHRGLFEAWKFRK